MNTIDAPPRRRRWPRVLLALAGVGLLMTLSFGALLWHGLAGPHGLAAAGEWRLGLGPDGWHGELGPTGVLAALAAVGVTLFVVAGVVPLVLLGTGLAVGLSLALAAGGVLLALGVVAGGAVLLIALATSPLWLVGLLLWWALRPRRGAVASSASA